MKSLDTSLTVNPLAVDTAIHIVILGSGPSSGLPNAVGHWGRCDRKNPKNQRMRSSLVWREITLNRREEDTDSHDTGPCAPSTHLKACENQCFQGALDSRVEIRRTFSANFLAIWGKMTSIFCKTLPNIVRRTQTAVESTAHQEREATLIQKKHLEEKNVMEGKIFYEIGGFAGVLRWCARAVANKIFLFYRRLIAADSLDIKRRIDSKKKMFFKEFLGSSCSRDNIKNTPFPGISSADTVRSISIGGTVFTHVERHSGAKWGRLRPEHHTKKMSQLLTKSRSSCDDSSCAYKIPLKAKKRKTPQEPRSIPLLEAKRSGGALYNWRQAFSDLYRLFQENFLILLNIRSFALQVLGYFCPKMRHAYAPFGAPYQNFFQPFLKNPWQYFFHSSDIKRPMKSPDITSEAGEKAGKEIKNSGPKGGGSDPKVTCHQNLFKAPWEDPSIPSLGDTGVWLMDAGPDLRLQSLRQNLVTIHGVLCTHAHYDHSGGISDLKVFTRKDAAPLGFWTDVASAKTLMSSVPYAWHQEDEGRVIGQKFGKSPLAKSQKGFLRWHCVEPGVSFSLGNQNILPFEQDHRYSITLGFRFPRWAYSTDVWALSPEALGSLTSLDLWIVDCLSHSPNDTHGHLEKTLLWIHRLKPRFAVLTHMGSEMDYDELKAMLPPNILPAYDGMEIILTPDGNIAFS